MRGLAVLAILVLLVVLIKFKNRFNLNQGTVEDKERALKRLLASNRPRKKETLIQAMSLPVFRNPRPGVGVDSLYRDFLWALIGLGLEAHSLTFLEKEISEKCRTSTIIIDALVTVAKSESRFSIRTPVVEILLKHLEVESKSPNEKAIETLATVAKGEPTTSVRNRLVEILLKHLELESRSPNEKAIKALAELKETRALGPLAGIMSRYANASAAAALVTIGTDEAVRSMLKVLVMLPIGDRRRTVATLEKMTWLPPTVQDEVRWAVAKGDYELATTVRAKGMALPLLLKEWETPGAPELPLARALVKIGDKSALDKLQVRVKRYLSHGQVRQVCPLIDVLARRDCARTADALLDCLENWYGVKQVQIPRHEELAIRQRVADCLSTLLPFAPHDTLLRMSYLRDRIEVHDYGDTWEDELGHEHYAEGPVLGYVDLSVLRNRAKEFLKAERSPKVRWKVNGPLRLRIPGAEIYVNADYGETLEAVAVPADAEKSWEVCVLRVQEEYTAETYTVLSVELQANAVRVLG